MLGIEIDRGQHVADRLRADAGAERVVTVIVDRLLELVFVEQLVQLKRRQAGLHHHIVLEIENPFEILQRHVEQQADAAGQRLHEPDMRDRRGEHDMAHALAAHLGQRHFDAALLADDAAILHALVLAAQAFVVLDRPEDARAEQAVALRLEGAVVDRLGLLDLAIRPGTDAIGIGDRDADLVEALGARGLTDDLHQLVHLPTLLREAETRLEIDDHGVEYQVSRCVRSTLRPSDRSSFTNTLKDSGIPASKLSSPRTMAS